MFNYLTHFETRQSAQTIVSSDSILYLPTSVAGTTISL